MKVYIAGPMTGYEDFNHPAFHLAAKSLRDGGYEVACPAEADNGSVGQSWEHYMRIDLKMLLDCDAVVTLDGWEGSRGASLEVFLACQLGMPRMALDEALDRTAVSA